MMKWLAFLLASTQLLIACTKDSTMAPLPVPVVVPIDTTPVKYYLALGDSYTIGQSVAVNERFPVQTVNLLNLQRLNFAAPEIIAQTGWTTSNLLYRLNDAPPNRPSYDIVTLLIGVNNQYQGLSKVEYKAQFTTLLNQAIQYAGNRPNRVVVLSIPDYSVTPFAANSNQSAIAQDIYDFNQINLFVAQQAQVNYLNITDFTRLAITDPSLVAGDGLHPSGKEYGVWTNALVPIIQSALR